MDDKNRITASDIEKAVEGIRNRPEPEQFIFTLTFPDGRKTVRCSDEEAYRMMMNAWSEKHE